MRFNLPYYWYHQPLHPLVACLLPFSCLFAMLAAVRRFLYRYQLLKTIHFSVPVVVVGNIVAGGTGKTPFVVWLVTWLREQGYRPGIVSRGVGGQRQLKPRHITADDLAVNVGDEALLLAKNAQCPVVICVDRVAAVEALLKHHDCNIVISDDGLQHYRMGRQIEIAIVDGDRRFGNGYLLPAGPLREPVKRLDSVDFVVVNGGNGRNEQSMRLESVEFVSVVDQTNVLPLNAFYQRTVHAVAGIGNPARFFDTLKKLGCMVVPHSFPDHHLYDKQELEFGDRCSILMTEKDAVKCVSFADERYWFLRVRANIENEQLKQAILKRIGECSHANR